jgi:ferric-dicitrate binding protein FerR (iron transport regulator)
MSNDSARMDTLLARHFSEIASEDELHELANLLATEPLAARRFAAMAWQEYCLVDELRRQATGPRLISARIRSTRSVRPVRPRPRVRFPRWIGAAAAASVALCLGLILLVPRPSGPSAAPDLAEVTEIAPGEDTGTTIAHLTHDGVVTPLTVGSRLAPGDRLDAERSRVQLRYHSEDTELSLQPGGILRCAADATGKIVTLERGRVVAAVAKQPPGTAMRFRTATAEAVVVGTRLAVSLGAEGDRLDVQEGLVRFGTLTGSADLAVPAGASALLAPEAPRPALLPHQPMPLTVWQAATEPPLGNTSEDFLWTRMTEPGTPTFIRLVGKPNPKERYGWFAVSTEAQDWSLATGLLVRIRGRGDGSTWTVEINDGQPVEHFVQAFIDDRREWRDVYLPFTAFVRRAALYQRRDAPDDGLGLTRMSGFGIIGAARDARLDIATIHAVIR